jgi:hypothetical protein
MRTTIDIDPQLHAEALEQSRVRRVSLSHLLNDALRVALHPAPAVEVDSITGLGVVRLGRPITESDVAAALDDD